MIIINLLMFSYMCFFLSINSCISRLLSFLFGTVPQSYLRGCILDYRPQWKWKESCSVMSDSLRPHGPYSPCNSPGQDAGVGSLSLLQKIFPGIKPRSPALRMASLPAEPQGKPKNTGVGSPSLLQEIFLAQELNRGLLHCRQILYLLSYKGSHRPR